MTHLPSGGEGDDDGPRVWIVEDRPSQREGKALSTTTSGPGIAKNLESAYVALNEAFRGIWIEKAQ